MVSGMLSKSTGQKNENKQNNIFSLMSLSHNNNLIVA